MTGTIRRIPARRLSRPSNGMLLLTLFIALLIGCGDSSDGQAPEPQAAPEQAPQTTTEPADNAAAEPTPEPTPQPVVEEAPEGRLAVVAARPHSDALKAVLEGISKRDRARVNPFADRPGEGGKADYALLCASCHGGTAQGEGTASVLLGGTATNLIASLEGENLSEGERFVVAKKGIPGTHMQPFGAARSDAQLWKILAHIDSLR